MPFGFSPISRNTSTDARIRRAGASTLGSFDMPIDVKLYGGQEFRIIRANASNPLVETSAYTGGGGELFVNGWLRFDTENSVAGCGILFDDPDLAATQALISFDTAYDVGGLLLSPDVLVLGGKVRVNGNMWFHNDKKLDFGTVVACSIFTDGTGDLILDTDTELAGRNIVLRGPVVLEGDLDIKTGKVLTFLTAAGADGASLQYGDTTGLIVSPTIPGGGVMSVLGDIKLNDSVKLGLGTGSTNTNFDAAIYYDGTNLVLDPDVIGSGVVRILGGARISSSSAMTFGTTDNGTIVYNGTDLVIDPDALGVGVLRIGGHVYLDDNKQVTLGTGQDALLYYDGTDLVVNPKSVGTGRVDISGNLKCDQVWLLDSEKVVLGTGSDAEIYYNGTDLVIDPDAIGVGVLRVGSHVYLDDSKQMTLGTGQDALLYYDGTDLVVNPKAVGTGRVDIVGNLKCDQVWLLDSEKILLGTGTAGIIDAEIYYNATNLVVKPDAAGTGLVLVDGYAKFADNDQLLFGSGASDTTGDASLYYDGTDLQISCSAGEIAITGDVRFPDNGKIRMGTGAAGSEDALIYYDGTNLIVNPQAVGTGLMAVTGGVVVADNSKFIAGTGNDAEIYYDGTNLIIQSAAVGTGDILLNSLPYGEMYNDGSSYTVNVVSANTAYEIDGGMSAGNLNGVTFPDDHYLQVVVAGQYLATWSLSLVTVLGTDAIRAGLMIGGVAQAKGTARVTSADTYLWNLSGTSIMTLAASNQVSLFVYNASDASDVTVSHASLTLLRIGS